MLGAYRRWKGTTRWYYPTRLLWFVFLMVLIPAIPGLLYMAYLIWLVPLPARTDYPARLEEHAAALQDAPPGARNAWDDFAALVEEQAALEQELWRAAGADDIEGYIDLSCLRAEELAGSKLVAFYSALLEELRRRDFLGRYDALSDAAVFVAPRDHEVNDPSYLGASQAARSAMRYLTAEAIDALRAGDVDRLRKTQRGAFAVIRAVSRQGELLDMLVGNAMYSDVQGALIREITERPPRREVLRALADEWGRRPAPLAPSDALEGARIDGLWSVEMLYRAEGRFEGATRSKIGARLLARQEEVMVIVNAAVSATSQRIDLPRGPRGGLPAPASFAHHEAHLALLATVIGQAERIARSHDACVTANAALEVVLAIELYRLDHDGEPPATLDLLTPDYLPEIPPDRVAIDGRLRYRLLAPGEDPEGWDRRYLLYSIGMDDTDELGERSYQGALVNGPNDPPSEADRLLGRSPADLRGVDYVFNTFRERREVPEPRLSPEEVRRKLEEEHRARRAARHLEGMLDSQND